MKFYFHILLFFVIFAEITHRFQSAREDVRALLLQCLLPWLQNMELVATSVPPATPLSYIMVRCCKDKCIHIQNMFFAVRSKRKVQNIRI